MLDRWRNSHSGKNQGDEGFHNSLIVFHQHVQVTITGVDDIINNLSQEYSKEALFQISEYFEGISRMFTSYTISTANTFYEVVFRSKLRTKAVKTVASKAKNVAKLFERYGKKPNSYSLVNSRLEIYKLRDVLENLLAHLVDKTSH
jgi:TfoX/Sxy family transcriptional regulator of competence genes